MTPALFCYSIQTSGLKVAVRMRMRVSLLKAPKCGEIAVKWIVVYSLRCSQIHLIHLPLLTRALWRDTIWLLPFTYIIAAFFFLSFLPNTFIEVFFTSIHAKQYSASIALLMTSRLEHVHHTHSYAHFPWQPQTPSYHQSSHASDAMKQQGWKKLITFTVCFNSSIFYFKYCTCTIVQGASIRE